MIKQLIYLIILSSLNYFGFGQFPTSYDLATADKLELAYYQMWKKDSADLAIAATKTNKYFVSVNNYNKIKSVARDIKLAGLARKQQNTQLANLNYINSKLETYAENYGLTLVIRFSDESFSKFKTDLTKIILKLISEEISVENCIVAEIFGSYNGTSFENQVGYKLHTLGGYSELKALNNYTKIFNDPVSSYNRTIFEDLDDLFSNNQAELSELSSENSTTIGGDQLTTAMQKAGTDACAFCKVCSQISGNTGSPGTISVGDGFSAPIRIIKNKNIYNCVIANYNAANSTVFTSLPSDVNIENLSGNKISPKGNQFIILKKTVLGEDEFITCEATQVYNDYCSAPNPFFSQTFRDKVAQELQSCAQQEAAVQQQITQKFNNLTAKSLTYIYESGYLLTKPVSGGSTLKQCSQNEYNQLIKDLKAGVISANEAIVFKKTASGYQVLVNYGQNINPKQGYEMNGNAVNKSEIAFETVMNNFLRYKPDLSSIDYQNASGIFEDGKKIEVKASSIWNKIQEGVKATREFIEEAEITPKYYNSSDNAYATNWINTPPLLTGVGNGVIEEIKEIPQLVFLACDIATKEEVRSSIWNGFKGLTLDKVEKAASGLVNNWAETYSQGGDQAWHQGGKDGVMVFTILSPAGLLKNADDVLAKNLDEVAEKVRRKGDARKGVFGKTDIAGVKGFSDNISSLAAEQGISIKGFKVIERKAASALTNTEKLKINAIRNAIPQPNVNTIMQKVIPKSDIVKYTSGEYTSCKGFMTTAADSKHLNTFEDIYHGMRLDYNGTRFSLSDQSCGVIRFKANNSNTAIVPTDLPNPDPFPFTNHGFTSGNKGRLGVPEWKLDNFAELRDGAELWEVFSNGRETLKAVFNKDLNKFISLQ